jgi:hypothetical protein
LKKTILFILITTYICSNLLAQSVPSTDEKFPFLCTFSKNSAKDWGDDDFTQVFFFVIPINVKTPFYIRIFDADVGGENDEVHGSFDSKTKFTVYGGDGAHSNPDAKKTDPIGNYESGIQLVSKTLGVNPKYDNKWLSLGPFNPIEGELQTDYGGYIFKIIIKGISGDDGNMYKMFLSSSQTENNPVQGGNSFSYEYSLRLPEKVGSISHLYPFINPNVVSIKIYIFDYDNEGIIRLVSVATKNIGAKSSGNNEWRELIHKVKDEEHNTSIDIQFIKQKQVHNNNVVVYITNQYGEMMPFYSAPIGGVPKFKYKIGVKPSH